MKITTIWHSTQEYNLSQSTTCLIYTMLGNTFDKWIDQMYVLFRRMILEIPESLSSFNLPSIIHQINWLSEQSKEV